MIAFTKIGALLFAALAVTAAILENVFGMLVSCLGIVMFHALMIELENQQFLEEMKNDQPT